MSYDIDIVRLVQFKQEVNYLIDQCMMALSGPIKNVNIISNTGSAGASESVIMDSQNDENIPLAVPIVNPSCTQTGTIEPFIETIIETGVKTTDSLSEVIIIPKTETTQDQVLCEFCVTDSQTESIEQTVVLDRQTESVPETANYSITYTDPEMNYPLKDSNFNVVKMMTQMVVYYDRLMRIYSSKVASDDETEFFSDDSDCKISNELEDYSSMWDGRIYQNQNVLFQTEQDRESENNLRKHLFGLNCGNENPSDEENDHFFDNSVDQIDYNNVNEAVDEVGNEDDYDYILHSTKHNFLDYCSKTDIIVGADTIKVNYDDSDIFK